jgi:hypothetical protein
MKINQKITIIFLFNLLFITISLGQTLTQTVKGKILDAETKAPLTGVNIMLLDTDPMIGSTTDEQGKFRLENVPVGRASLSFTYLGYEDYMVSEILVGSAKEVSITVYLTEELSQLDEVVLVAPKDRITPNNKLAAISARSFSVEETKRFPASISDPGRMALSFAGVSNSDDETNEIIIRGNAPNQLLWRIEGVEVPEPNHFSEEGYSPGAVSLLSSNMLGKSDFFTGAFPATYGNALSGVFDIQLRNGNADKAEYAFQFGVLGTDLTVEGPFNKNHKSSYLINYRYSTLSVLNEIVEISDDGIPTYQDLSFKLNFPLNKKTNLSFWGIGGISEDNQDEEIIGDFKNNEIFESKTFMSGLTLSTFLKNGGRLESRLSFSGNASDFISTEENTINQQINGDSDILKNSAFRISSTYNKKLNPKTTFNTGFIASFLNYDVLTTGTVNRITLNLVNEKDNGSMFQAFAQAKYRFNTKLSTTFGLHSTYFSVNEDATIEPRFGLEYKLNRKHIFSAGFGMHSRRMPLNQYFIKLANGSTPNTNVDLMQATHYILGYDWRLIKNGHLKIEVYYQALNKVAIVNNINSTDAYINGQFINAELTDTGKGKNYGLELTFEKFFSNQYYFLITSSFYDTQYRTLDKQWYDSRYNYNYTFNVVGGKEFSIGDNNILGFSGKVLLNGGKRGTPINIPLFNATGEVELDESLRNTLQFNDYFRADISINYRINRPKVAHIISLDIQNVSNQDNIDNQFYNSNTGESGLNTQLGLVPFINYKIEFKKINYF